MILLLLRPNGLHVDSVCGNLCALNNGLYASKSKVTSEFSMKRKKKNTSVCEINCTHFKSYYTIYYGMPIQSIFFLSLVTRVLFLCYFLPRFYVSTFRPCLTFSCFTTFTAQHFEPTYPLYQRPKFSTEIRAGWNNISASVTTFVFFVTQMSNVEREIRKKLSVEEKKKLDRK